MATAALENPAVPTETPADEPESLRDTLDAAFTAAEASDDAPEPGAAPATAPADGTRQRDEHGRFAPRQQATEPGAEAPPQGAPAAPGAAAPEFKAPASWKPQVREKWAGVDPEVKAEVHRREFEYQQTLRDAAGARQFADEFGRTVQPYELFMRAEGANPLQAVQYLMQAAADLRVGTPQRKAQLVAEIITQHGVSIEALDSLLAGQVPAPGQPQEFRDPRFDQFLAQQQAYMQQQQAAQAAEMKTKIEAFGQSHEFLADVAVTMADLIELKQRRGEGFDLENTYAQACQMHEGVRNILTQRAASAKSGSQSQAVLRAKRAASSVRSESTPDSSGATVPKNDSVRAAIEAAIDTLGRT